MLNGAVPFGALRFQLREFRAAGFGWRHLGRRRLLLREAVDKGAHGPNEAGVRKAEDDGEQNTRRKPRLVAAQVGPAKAEDGEEILHVQAVIQEEIGAPQTD